MFRRCVIVKHEVFLAMISTLPQMAHVALLVKDLDRMERFYLNTFGLRLKYRYTSENQPGLRLVFLQAGNIELELMQYPEPPASAWPGHLAFYCEDVEAEYKRLDELGCCDLTQPRETGDRQREFSLNL